MSLWEQSQVYISYYRNIVTVKFYLMRSHFQLAVLELVYYNHEVLEKQLNTKMTLTNRVLQESVLKYAFILLLIPSSRSQCFFAFF